MSEFSLVMSDRFLLDLPRSGSLGGGWSYRKHGAGARLTAGETGKVIDLLRLDRYRDDEIVPLEFSQFLESSGISEVDAYGLVVHVGDEAALSELLASLARVGLLERREYGWVLAERQTA